MIPHKIAILLLDHVVPMDMGTAMQVFGSTGGRYDLRICSPGGKPVSAESGLCEIAAPHDLSIIKDADTVLIPGIHGGPPFIEGTVSQGVPEALRAVSGKARLISICTGAFVLAAAGLLDGRPATTHWRHASRFAQLYPDVRLDPDVLFVDDGDVLTSAGVTAGVDLCLHVVRRDFGAEVANYAARRCVTPAWRDGGQAQFIERPVPLAPEATTSPTRGWAQSRLHESLDLSVMADHAKMSVRTFNRRIR